MMCRHVQSILYDWARNCNSMLTTLGWACEELFWFPSFMGIADFILAGEGDLYDMNEYHMLAYIIIRNKVDDFGTSVRGCTL